MQGNLMNLQKMQQGQLLKHMEETNAGARRTFSGNFALNAVCAYYSEEARIGTWSVQKTAERSGGTASFTCEGGMFMASVLLYG